MRPRRSHASLSGAVLDVDWTAGLVRVRRSYTRGEFTEPKSRRSSRAVPMADRLAGELERHFQSSAYTGDDDLVFAMSTRLPPSVPRCVPTT